MMKSVERIWGLGAFMMLVSSVAVAADQSIILQSTTSTKNSGLYDFILPKFKEASGIIVNVVAVGTGQAIQNARELRHRPPERRHRKAAVTLQPLGKHPPHILHADPALAVRVEDDAERMPPGLWGRYGVHAGPEHGPCPPLAAKLLTCSPC